MHQGGVATGRADGSTVYANDDIDLNIWRSLGCTPAVEIVLPQYESPLILPNLCGTIREYTGSLAEVIGF